MRGFDPAELSRQRQTMGYPSTRSDGAAEPGRAAVHLCRKWCQGLGGGCGIRETGALLNVPVGLTWMAMDLLDDDDPLFVGRPGTVASRGANFALQNADFVLVIGARLDPPLMGWDPRQFARGAYKAVVDIDPAELRKLEGVIDNPICADARGFIEAMLQQGGSVLDRTRPQPVAAALP